jgi:hypothetical protein
MLKMNRHLSKEEELYGFFHPEGTTSKLMGGENPKSPVS